MILWFLAFALALAATLADPFLEVRHKVPGIMASGKDYGIDPMELDSWGLQTSLESERSRYVDFDSDGGSNHYGLVGESNRLALGLSGVFSGPSGSAGSGSLGSEVEEVNRELESDSLGSAGLGRADIPGSSSVSNREIVRMAQVEETKEVEEDVALGEELSATGGRVGKVSIRSGRIRGYSTYYHRSLAGGLMFDGETKYDPQTSGLVAAVGWPIGTSLYACGPSGRCLWLEVRDRGLLEPFRHLDLSEADFIVLAGSLRLGRVKVKIKEEIWRD